MTQPRPGPGGVEWVRPPPIFGPDVHAWATADLRLPLGMPGAGPAFPSPKRNGEFAAGRRCAARALREAGSRETAVGIGARRDPQWPSGFVGSITHSPSFACAAVASRARLRSIGVDMEPIFDEHAMREVAPATVTDRESALGGALCAPDRATLVFSAKESFYKCVYPIARIFFDFTDAEVDCSAPFGTFRVRLLRDLGSSFSRGAAFEGRYAIAQGHVHTALELRT